MKNKLTLVVFTLLLTFAFLPAALADTVNVTLTQSLLGAQPGSTVTFEATLSAPIGNGGDIFLNGGSGDLGTFMIDATDFISNAPFFLSPGHSATFDIFTVQIPLGTPLGIYGGFFEILGGADGSVGDRIGTVDFSVAATPEPSSLLLLGTGLVGALTTLRRNPFRRA